MGQLLQRPSTAAGGGGKAIGASVHLATNQGTTSGLQFAPPWTNGTALDFDTSNFFAPATPTFFTIPFTGLYKVSCSVLWASSGAPTQVFSLSFFVNASTVNHGLSQASNGGALNITNNLSVLLSLNTGDIVTASLLQNTTGPVNIIGNAANASSSFSIYGVH